MSVLNSDQLHRSTLGIYVTLMEQFNPNLTSFRNVLFFWKLCALYYSFEYLSLYIYKTMHYFLRESQREALKEQERRYRFLAEKHCGLTQSIVYLINKVQHQLIFLILYDIFICRLDQEPLCTSHPVSFFLSLGPSPQPVRSRSSSFGESLGVGGARIMRALVPHSSSSNPTLLSFSRGETITVLVSAPQNGWLYGRSENSARSLRSSSSLSNILDQSTSSRSHAPPPPPPAPPSKSNSSWPVTPTPSEKTVCSKEQKIGTNPFATVKLKPTTTNDRSAPCLF
uniref:SH3 domain-containing protein n=1 Tax=Electrophorus electricus TaxID=8005 RepID=A0AAY5F4E3_ELEEL